MGLCSSKQNKQEIEVASTPPPNQNSGQGVDGSRTREDEEARDLENQARPTEDEVKGSSKDFKVASEAATALATHSGVVFHGYNGSITLYKGYICYSTNEDQSTDPIVLRIAWKHVSKFQPSPGKLSKALFKFNLTSGGTLTFQLENREALTNLNEDVSLCWKGQESNGSSEAATNQQNSYHSIHETIEFRKVGGFLTLSESELCHYSEGGAAAAPKTLQVAWDQVTKLQASPQSHPTALLKLVLVPGEACTFRCKNRPALQALKDDIAARLNPQGDPIQDKSESGKSMGRKKQTTQSKQSSNATSTKKCSPTVFQPVRWNNEQGSIVVEGGALCFQPKKKESARRSIPWTAITMHSTTGPISSPLLLTLTLNDGTTDTVQLRTRETLECLSACITEHLSSSQSTKDHNHLSHAQEQGTNGVDDGSTKPDAAVLGKEEDAQPEKTNEQSPTNTSSVNEPTPSAQMKSNAKVNNVLLKFKQAQELSNTASEAAKMKLDNENKLLEELHSKKKTPGDSPLETSTQSDDILSNGILDNSDVDSEVDVDDVDDEASPVTEVATDSENDEEDYALEHDPTVPVAVQIAVPAQAANRADSPNGMDSDVDDHSDVEIDSDDDLDSDG